MGLLLGAASTDRTSCQKLILGVKFADGIEVIGNSAVPEAQAAV
jgi:hypothetical protein